MDLVARSTGMYTTYIYPPQHTAIVMQVTGRIMTPNQIKNTAINTIHINESLIK